MTLGYAHKVDRTQESIVSVLRQAGWSVAITSRLGGGFPDAVLGRVGVTLLAEIKTEQEGLNGDQKEFHDEWRGSRILILRTPEQALADAEHAAFAQLGIKRAYG